MTLVPPTSLLPPSLTPPPSSVAGQFAHHDLMTPEPARARPFYSALLGWDCEPRTVQGVEYTAVSAGGRPLGGIVPLDPAHGVAPHWIGYVAVDDVDAACARAAAAGGVVHVPTHPLPDGGGHFAVIADPTGAVVSVVHFLGERPEPAGPDVAGGAWWHELLTTDVRRSIDFHAAVFGWEARPAMAIPGGGTYYLVSHAGRDVAGLMAATPDLPTSAWQTYFTVTDVDAALTLGQALGGTITWRAMDLPGVGRVAGMADPTGALFAVGCAETA